MREHSNTYCSILHVLHTYLLQCMLYWCLWIYPMDLMDTISTRERSSNNTDTLQYHHQLTAYPCMISPNIRQSCKYLYAGEGFLETHMSGISVVITSHTCSGNWTMYMDGWMDGCMHLDIVFVETSIRRGNVVWAIVGQQCEIKLCTSLGRRQSVYTLTIRQGRNKRHCNKYHKHHYVYFTADPATPPLWTWRKHGGWATSTRQGQTVNGN